MSLSPVSTFLTVLGSRVSLRSFVQLKLTKNCHLCHFRSSRDFGSSSALLFCSNTREDGWQPIEWQATIPASQVDGENLSKRKMGWKVVIRDSDSSLVKQISLIEGATELLEFMETVEPYLFNDRVLEITSKCLFNYLKTETSVAVKKNILQSIGMQKFCRLVKEQSDSTEAVNLVLVLKVFSILSAPGTHPTFQYILRLLSKKANTLRTNELIHLDFLLEKMNPISKSALTEALVLAIPIMFESQLKSQMDSTNVHELYDKLTYIVKRDMSGSAVQTVIDAFMKGVTIKEAEAFNMLWLLAEYKQNIPEEEEFVGLLFKTVTTNLHQFSSQRIANLIRKIAQKYIIISGKSYWYNEQFVTSACHRLVECGDDTALICFKSLTLMRHVDLEFMETVVRYVLKEPTVFLDNEKSFFSTLRGLASAAYKPEKWKLFQPMLLKHPALTKDVGMRTVPIITDFLALDVLATDLVSKAFSPSNVHHLKDWQNRHGPFVLLLILNAIRHLHPEYKGPLPPLEMVQQWERQALATVRKPRALVGAFQCALGGSDYLLSNVFQGGLCIDHCILVHQDNPIPFQDTKPHSLKHIKIPANSSLILIQVYSADAYASNTNRLRGLFTILSKVLRIYGHPLIEIDLGSWRKLSDADKIPWLMQKIREYTDRGVSKESYY